METTAPVLDGASGTNMFDRVKAKPFRFFKNHEIRLLGEIGSGGQGNVVRVSCKPPLSGLSKVALKITSGREHERKEL